MHPQHHNSMYYSNNNVKHLLEEEDVVPYSSSFIGQWYYTYKVHFTVGMITPLEAGFCNVVIVLVAILLMVALLYLPQNTMLLANRAYYYWSGHETWSTPASPNFTQILGTAINKVYHTV